MNCFIKSLTLAVVSTLSISAIAQAQTAAQSSATAESSDFPPVSTQAADLIAQETPNTQETPNNNQVVEITGVNIQTTEAGVEIKLQTSSAETLRSSTQVEGTTLITEIENAVLTLPEGQSFRQQNPAEGMTEITVTQLQPTQIQVRVAGVQTVPDVQVSSGADGLVLSVTPDLGAEAETEITVTAEQEQEGYRVPNASTATKTDTPVRDLPGSIQVIPQQVLKEQNLLRLNDSLRNVSGVQPDDSFGGQIDRVNIRGFSTDTFLRDGIRQSQFSTRETENIDRIEVLKGPASVLYGNLEPGGAINLVSKQPLADPYYAAELSVGSFTFVRPSFDLSGPLNADKTVLYRLNGAYEHNNGFRDFQTNTDRVFVAPALTWKISDQTDLTLDFSYLNDSRPFDEGTVAIGDGVADIPRDRILADANNRRRVEEFQVGYSFEHRFSDRWKLRNRFSYLSSDTSDFRLAHWIIEDDGTLDRRFVANQDTYDSFSLNTDVTGTFKTGPIEHTLLIGLDLNRETTEGSQRRLPGHPSFFTNIFTQVSDPLPNVSRADLTEFGRNDSREQNRLGFYLQDQIKILENLKILLGGRFDLYDRTSVDRLFNTTTEDSVQRFSPRVGLVYQPIEPISLYASFSQSFNPDDLLSVQADGSVVDPSTATQYEAGIKGEFLNQRLSATLAAYRINKTNIATTDPNNPAFSIPVGEVRSQGIELDIVGEPIPGWNLIASYAYTDAEVTEDNFFTVGNRVANVPLHSASLWSTYELQSGSLKGLGFGLGLFVVGDRPGDFDNSFTLPGYLRTDATLFYRRDNVRLGLNFQNLFNVDYAESSAQFRESIYEGEPFTIIGSVSIKF
jgi:iron complex outermembrane recepter protein